MGQHEDNYSLGNQFTNRITNNTAYYNYPSAILDFHNLDCIVQYQLARERPAEARAFSSSRPSKQPRLSGRLSPVLAVRFQEKHGTPKCIRLNALMGSGTSSSICEQQFAKKLRKKRGTQTTWNTAAETFSTSNKAKTHM